jgi:hypothetical protein
MARIKQKNILKPLAFLTLIWLALLESACSSESKAPTVTPTPIPTEITTPTPVISDAESESAEAAKPSTEEIASRNILPNKYITLCLIFRHSKMLQVK